MYVRLQPSRLISFVCCLGSKLESFESRRDSEPRSSQHGRLGARQSDPTDANINFVKLATTKTLQLNIEVVSISRPLRVIRGVCSKWIPDQIVHQLILQ